MKNINIKEKTLQINLHKNNIEVYPLMSFPESGYKEWDLKDLSSFLEEYIAYFFLKKEVTLITIKNSFSIFFEEFDNTIPITAITKKRLFGLLPDREYVAFYLSYLTCTNSFISNMLSQNEWWMDNIGLTSLSKKEEILLKEILEKDLEEKSNKETFSPKISESIPDLFIPINDGYGFIFYNPTEGLENALNKVKEFASKWHFKIKIEDNR